MHRDAIGLLPVIELSLLPDILLCLYIYMFRDLRQSGGSRKKRSPTKKQLAALAKGRAVRMRNIRKNKKTKIQRGGAFCPEGTRPFNNRLHCCRQDTDMVVAPINDFSRTCKNNDYFKCENELDHTIPNEICYKYLSDREKTLDSSVNRRHKNTLQRLLVSHKGTDLTREERAYFENVRFHYGTEAAMITLLEIGDWNTVMTGQRDPRVIRDHISGTDVSFTGPPPPVPESPSVLAKFGRMPDWAYVQSTAVPVAEQAEDADGAGAGAGEGAGIVTNAGAAVAPNPQTKATGAAEDDDSSSSSEDDEV